MIYTSYFAKMKYLPKDILPISICAKNPTWYKGEHIRELAPSFDLLFNWKRMQQDEEYYTKRFKEEILVGIDLKALLNYFNYLCGIGNFKGVCLLCYEKPSDFCHRHLVAEWLRENGIKCEEYDYDR